MTPDSKQLNKGYRRKNWSHEWKCTVLWSATPYTFGQRNQKIHFFHSGSHVFDCDIDFLHKLIMYGVVHLVHGVVTSDSVSYLT